MKECIICTTSFKPYRSIQVACSRDCYTIHKKSLDRKYYLKNRVLIGRRAWNKGKKAETYSNFSQRSCVDCNKLYKPTVPNQKSCNKTCRAVSVKKYVRSRRITHPKTLEHKLKTREYHIRYRELNKEHLIKESHIKNMKLRKTITCACGKDYLRTQYRKAYCGSKCRTYYLSKKIKEYFQRPEIKERSRGYNRKRYENPINRLNKNIGHQILKSLKAKRNSKNGRKWESLTRYNIRELKTHIENQFKQGMTWENMGGIWHLDHRIPQSWFSYDTTEDIEFKRCWALDNLKPEFAKINLSKNNRYSEPTLSQEWHYNGINT